jgi:hypothetical protein
MAFAHDPTISNTSAFRRIQRGTALVPRASCLHEPEGIPANMETERLKGYSKTLLVMRRWTTTCSTMRVILVEVHSTHTGMSCHRWGVGGLAHVPRGQSCIPSEHSAYLGGLPRGVDYPSSP